MDIGTEVWVKSATPAVWLPGVVLECQAVGAAGVVKVRLEGGGGGVVTTVFAPAGDDSGDATSSSNNSTAADTTELHIRNKERDVDALASLTGLEHLHEPALLHALSERFQRDRIYTSIGDILVAVNPLKALDVYAPSAIERYKRAMYDDASADGDRARSSSMVGATGGGGSATEELPPHVFAIGARAFGGLLKREQRNQSILVSGESGSGKTESTKFLMQFLTAVGSDAVATAGGSSDSSSSSSGSDGGGGGQGAAGSDVVEIGRRILQTNPILESFGNAQTIRNDNSSRFGKFIKIQFGHRNEIVGAEIASYLLEKVRLIHQSPGERNFHIFYELLEGADAEQLAALGLRRGAKYELLNAYGGPMNRRAAIGANQFAQRFAQTVQAFEDTGVDISERELIFRVLAALLHLGNVNFMMVVHEGMGESGTREESAAVTAATRHHFDKCAELLGVTPAGLESLLLTRMITAGSEVMVLKQNAEQAKDICRSLAKAIYGRVFSWLVRRLSDGINYCDNNSDVYDYDAPEIKTIGILDIFGFESLEQNGFEQLCINYANERLQAQFNEFVFIKEQDVYMSEDIDWRSIPYPSNEACLSLFDDKASGLFSLLDQECLMPKGSDEALSTKFYRYHGGSEGVTGGNLLKQQQSLPKYTLPQLVTSFGRYLQTPSEQVEKEPEPSSNGKVNPFFASKMDRVKHQFVVHHFAGKVCYRLEQFVEKNLDMLPSDVSSVLHASSNAIVSAIGDTEVMDQAAERAPGRRRYSLLRAPSVSAQFKSQLDRLVEEIGSTEAHYVRCLKPNELKRPGIFDRERMVEQLRSVGVLEALRIARAGYSVRLGHASFIELFSGFRSLVNLSFASARKSPQPYCAALVASLVREVLRKEGKEELAMKPVSSGILDTAADSGGDDAAAELCRRQGVQVGRTLVFCKTEAFNKFSRLRLELRDRSATILQRHYRGYRRRRRFQQLRDFVHRIQSIVRGFIARKQVRELRRERQERAANVIQRSWRMKLARNRLIDKKIRLFRVRAAFKLFCLAHTRLRDYVSDAEEPAASEEVVTSEVPGASSKSSSEPASKGTSVAMDKRSRAKKARGSDGDSEIVKNATSKKSTKKDSKKSTKKDSKKDSKKKSAAAASSSRSDKRRTQRIEESDSESSSSASSEDVPRKKKVASRSEKKHHSKYVEESESESSSSAAGSSSSSPSSSSSSDAVSRKKKARSRKGKHRARDAEESESEPSSDEPLRKKKSLSRGGKHRLQRVESSDSESESSEDGGSRRKSKKLSSQRAQSSKANASKKKKSRKAPADARNAKLESEILRLKLMLVEKQSTRESSRSSRRASQTARNTSSRFGIQEADADAMDVQTRANRRSLSLDENEFSAGEDEEGDEVSLLPPRRTQSVYHARQDHVTVLSSRIEELDAKCKFLEQLVARKSFDESSRASAAYAQRASGSSAAWDRRRYPSVIDSVGDGQFSERDFGTGVEVDGMIRSIQQQMDVLRQSVVATKEEGLHHHGRRDAHPTSFTSSRRTRSSSAASSGSLSGLLGDPMHYHVGGLLSPAESHRKQPSSAGSGYSAGSHGFPATPTSSVMSRRSLPIRTASMSSIGGGGGGGRHVPRIVKWARSNQCFECEEPFNIFVRRHHCRMCGNSFCHEHSSRRVTLLGIGFDDEPVRVCDACFADHCEYSKDAYPSAAAQYNAFPGFGGSSMSALASSHASAA